MLEKDFKMTMSVELERRMQIMCNLSEAIKEEATKNGMKAGIEQG
ncbi:MAG: nuclease, partial [Eubacterium sp.]|nr:nuclease [Eubacterium sp.]